MSLKDITKDKHHDAERTAFAKLLLSGKISNDQYAQYLYQMLDVYSVLEHLAAAHGLLEGLHGLPRAKGIYLDLQELRTPEMKLTTLPSTTAYIEYLKELAADPERAKLLLGHVYVRHMGDLFGGQMIKSRVPGSGKFYEFRNKDELVPAIRAKLTDEYGEEAKIAFDHAIAIMKELNEPSLVDTN